MKYVCIVCGRRHIYKGPAQKEGSNCQFCGATWRDRATLLLLTRGLRIPETTFPKWRTDFSRIGVGFDDGPVLASLLPKKLRYVNTHISEFPILDLTRPPKAALEFFEFALCTEVLEHVTGDPKIALGGLYQILRPGGFAIVTVPVSEDHEEWYPKLTKVVEQKNNQVRWID